MRPLIAIAPLLWLLSPQVARADFATGAPVTPANVWQAWNWDWLILLNLTLLGVTYAAGWHRRQRRGAVKHPVHVGQLIAFLISLVVLFVALISPLHALSEEASAAHMLQHMLIMVVAAPLFVFGSPGQVLPWSLEPSARSRLARWTRSLRITTLELPLWTWLLHTAVLWFWHWPTAYEAALVDPLVHDAEHLCFFAAAVIYWRPILDPLRRHQLQPLTAVASLFATSLQAMLLGIFLALAPAIWYESYRGRPEAWGLTPLEDQQLAGFLMWMPACLVYPALAALILGQWLQAIPQIRKSARQAPAV